MSKSAASLIFAGAVATLLLATPALSDDNALSGAVPDSVSATSSSPQEAREQGASVQEARAEKAKAQKARAQVDASVAHRVQREFDFSLGDITHILTPAQLRSALGVDDGRISNADGSTDRQLERIEVHASRKEPLQTRIPFGLASIAWGVMHPREAWRVFAPVVFG